MGLFGTKKVQTQEVAIRDCIKMIEGFFKRIGLNPSQQRWPETDTLGWYLQRGSALIYVILNQHGDTPTVRIVAPMLYLPDSLILPLYRTCLEMNMELINCAFGVIDDKVVLVSERPIAGLDAHELEGTIRYLSSMADNLDNKLSAEFKAPLYLERSSP